MQLTKYTKHVLNEGIEITVKVLKNGVTGYKNIARLMRAGGYYENGEGWFVDMTRENYESKCKLLRGFQMEYFIHK